MYPHKDFVNKISSSCYNKFYQCWKFRFNYPTVRSHSLSLRWHVVKELDS